MTAIARNVLDIIDGIPLLSIYEASSVSFSRTTIRHLQRESLLRALLDSQRRRFPLLCERTYDVEDLNFLLPIAGKNQGGYIAIEDGMLAKR